MQVKYFICSDICGNYLELIKALNKAGFDINNDSHILVSLGNLIGNGSFQKNCLEYFYQLLLRNRAIVIRGKEEFLIEQALKHGFVNNRCKDNMIILNDLELYDYNDDVLAAMKANTKWQLYQSKLRNFYSLGKYIFVYNWLPCYTDKYGKYATAFKFNEDWINANYRQWSNAILFDQYNAYKQEAFNKDNTIVCGGTSVHKYHDSYDIYKDKNIININGEVYRTHRVNILVLDQEEEF